MSRLPFALSAAVAAAGLALAADPPAADRLLRFADANNDGVVSRAEFDRAARFAPRFKDDPKAADAAFRRLDADGDGKLSAAELKAVAGLAAAADAKKKNPFTDPKVPAPADKPRPEKPTAAVRPDDPDAVAFFEKKIRPVLADKCYGCHSAAADKLKGGLALDTRGGVRAGGDSGPAVVPGNPARSLIVQAIKGDGVAQMPPKEKLSADVVADFERWVKMGAADPRTEKVAVRAPDAVDMEKARQHWSFQPPKKVAPPTVTDAAWPASDIDRFVRAKLDEKGLTPAADADKRTLLRRVHFDLTGLPPTPAEVEAFLADDSPTAFARVVDKLLASPAFGERWGRHWLDVARYAESSGKEQNMLYPQAWRYRDYVIAAFNADKPYDRFLKEQLAGDLLPAADDNRRAEQLIATGYLAVGPKSHNTRSALQFRLDLADEQIDAVTQGLLGLTVACARCHDHKFDPVPTKDYYALAGIFTSTETKFGTPSLLIARHGAPLQELPAAADVPAGESLGKRELERIKERLAELKKERDRAFEQARKDRMPPVQLVFLNVQIGSLEKQLGGYADDGSPKKLAMAAADRSTPRDSPIYLRGEPEKPGETVRRGFLSALPPGPKIASGSGRKELADWVASADNPLTARVMANRVWLHLFGRGLVPTPDNFGTTGQPPSHPELLDFLAMRFVERGWSVKSLVRDIVLSRSYRMASDHDPADAATDPDNVYLWRMSKRRLDAEALRDAMFAVAGELDRTPPRGSPVGRFEGPVQALQRFGGGVEKLADTPKRSVYLPVIRDQIPEALDLFDFAEPSLVTGARDDTSVPAQGLFLLNNPQVLKLADRAAGRLLKEHLSPSERIDAGFRLAFGRPPTTAEAASADGFLKRFAAAGGDGSRLPANQERAAWAAFAQALFAAAEFRYVD